MSTTIDERVVEMRFDNQHFERNVQTSLGTIDKLKSSLDLTGASKGLENIDAAAKNVNMSGLSSAVETVGLKFNALYTIADQALRNITNSAVNAGKRIVSALTIDPIKTGFNEYELKMGSIQTIMASTGEDLETVNKYLNELNEYSDKTIYSFSDMTQNIGKFTNAGVKLEDAVLAIQGISNEAAVSGANANEASRAMYNFAQALSSGYVKLIDWKSIENANMATVEFKNQLIETAVQLGTVTKTSDGMYQTLTGKTFSATSNFNDVLQEQWMTSDVLITTLKKYSDETTEIGKKAFSAAQDVKTLSQLFDTLKESAQSGWAQTWEYIVGDLSEAKTELRKINEIIGGVLEASADARNAVLEGWKEQGGRATLFESLYNILDAIGKVVTPIKQAFSDIFPPFTADTLVAITNALKEFTEKIKIGDTTSENLRRTFKGLFAVVDIVVEVFKALVNFVKPFFGHTTKMTGGILELTASFGDWLVKVRDFIKQSDVFNEVLQGIYTVLKFVGDAVKKVCEFLKDKVLAPGWEVFHAFLKRIHDRMSDVGEAAANMKTGFKEAIDGMGSALSDNPLLKVITAVWNGIMIFAKGVAKALGFLFEGVADAVGNTNFDGIFDFINSLSFSAIAVFIGKFVKGFSDAMDTVGDFKESVIGILDSVKDVFTAYQEQLKAQTLLTIAKAIGILALSLLVIALIDSDKLSGALGGLTMLLVDLMGALAIFGKISGDKTGMAKSAGFLVALSVAVLIMAGALKMVGSLNFGEMMTGLVGIAGLTAMMVGVVKILATQDANTVIKGATQMVIFAVAIKILASACKDLAALDVAGLAKGLIGVGVLLAEVSLFMQFTKFEGKAISTAFGIVLLSAAMKILASACKDFGSMDWDSLSRGLFGIGTLLTTLSVFITYTKPTDVLSTGVALVAIGAAMKIFASATKDMADMSWEELGRGLLGMAGALLAITLALKFMPANMGTMGLGLIAVSAALLIVANVMDKMSGMSWEELGRGLVALGGAIAILAVGLKLMTGTLSGAGALLVAAGALAIIGPVMSMLGAMSWAGVAKGLVTIAAAFTVLGVAGYLLAPVVSVILSLAGSFALIGLAIVGVGVGLMAAGVGLGLIATGIAALATALTAGATAIVAGLTAILIGVISLIPAIFVKIGEGIIAMCDVIAAGAPAIGRAIKALLLSAVDILVECIPVIVDAVMMLLNHILDALVENTPKVIDAIFQFLIGILDGISQNLPKLIQSAVNVIMAFFKGIVDALKGVDTNILLEGLVGVGILAALMMALATVAGLVPAAMLGVLGMAAVIAELALVLSAIGLLAQLPGLSWLINEGGELLESVGVAIGKFFGGLIGGFASGVSSQFPQIAADLSEFMINLQPFLIGAKMIDPAAMEGIKSLASAILALTAANVLEGITSWFTGGSSIVEFGKELAEFGPHFATYYESVKGVNADVVQASANAALALAEMASKLPNQGGVVGWFMGENSLRVFAEELAAFGPTFREYAQSMQGLDTSVVEASANAALTLAEMASKLPNQGGVVSWFTGDNTLSKFAEELAAFGPYMKEYANSVKGIDGEAVVNSANAAKALGEMAAGLPNSGGLVSWFTGDNDLGTFGKNLVKLGGYLKDYANKLGDTNVSRLKESTEAFVSIANTIRGLDGVEFGNLEAFSQSLNKIGISGVDGFIKAFSDAEKRITDTGNKTIDHFLNGVNTEMPNVKDAFAHVLDSAVAAIQGKYSSFANAGSHLVSGFASGISESTYKAEAAAAAMAAAAARAAEEELDINSPSRVGYGIGRFFGMGFVNAITDYASRSYDAGSAVAESARRGLNNSINKIRDFIDSGMDTQPTIRPVLDLSDIRSGAGTISSLLGMDTPMSVLSNVGSISAMMNNRNQNGNVDDILSAINKLGKDLANAGGTTYSINGITYDDGTNISEAVKSIVRAARIERRV